MMRFLAPPVPQARRRLRGRLLGLILALTAFAAVATGLAAPVPLVENRGQLPDTVLFHGDTDGATVFFTADGVVIDVVDDRGGRTAVRIPVTADAVAAGMQKLPTRFSFFRGQDPDRWQRAVPCWATVVYRLPATGERVRWDITPEGLRYHVEGDPGKVTTAFTPRLEGNATGAVTVTAAPDGAVIAWRGRGRDRETSRDADTGLLWSTFLGHAASDKGLGVALADDGAAIAVGRTRSAEFPTTVGSYDTDNAGLNDVFVSRFSPDGASLVWSTFLGSSGDDAGMGVALAADGDVVITGLASAGDWPTTAGAHDVTSNGLRDAVVARLAATGDILRWSTYLGGAGNDVANRVHLDADDCPVLVGETTSFDWPTTPGAHDRLHGGDWDGFVARLAADGSTLMASTFLGASDYDVCKDQAALGAGHVVVVGSTHSPEFPTTPGAFATDHAGGEDGYVACLATTDASLIWSTFLGGNDADAATRVAVDIAGHPVVTGGTHSADFPTTAGVHDQTHNGHEDAFLAKLTGDGAGLVWSTFLGGSDTDRGLVIHLDPTAGVTVLGYTLSTDLPTTPAAFDPTANGSFDIFAHRLSSDASHLLAGTYLGGEERDEAYAAVGDADGNLLLIGMTHSSTFPVTAGAYDTSYGGNADAFVARIDPRTWYPVGVEAAPASVLTAQAHPNPFNPRVTIAYDLPRAGTATVRIFDTRGRLVRTLRGGARPAGRGEMIWDGRDGGGRDQASGTYLFEVRSGATMAGGKLTMVR